MTPAARARRRVRTPALVATAAAWAALLATGHLGTGTHTGHVMPAGHAMSMGSQDPRGSWALGLMLVAMMAPMTIAPVRHVVERSFARRRRRAAALMLAGYAATWVVGGVLLVAVSVAMRAALPGAAAALVAVAGAVVWQWSPYKQRCLNRAHTHRGLAAFGRAADVDAARFGAEHAIWCVGSCWALMLVPFVVDGSYLAPMALVTLWLWAERLDRPRPPTWSVRVPAKAARLAIARARTYLLLPTEHAAPS